MVSSSLIAVEGLGVVCSAAESRPNSCKPKPAENLVCFLFSFCFLYVVFFIVLAGT